MFGVERGASLRDRRVAVLGLGKSGLAAIELLRQLGAAVLGLDEAADDALRARTSTLDVQLRIGDADSQDLEGVDLVVTSPGVRPTSAWRVAAVAAGVPVWSEIELAWRAGIRPLAAITGTNGKTTATRMATEALRAAGIPAVSGGNIGTPLSALRPGQPVVAEVSSFQLDTCHSFHAPVGVFLNLAPDHLDWHGSMEAYGAAKERLFRVMDEEDHAIAHTSVVAHARVGAALVNAFDVVPPQVGQTLGVADGYLVDGTERIVEIAAMKVRHTPFLLDALAAAGAACALGADRAAVGAALAAFVPDPHRMETVAVIGDVTYINDSKATDPHATEHALGSIEGDTILIAGGLNKGLAFETVAAAASRVRLAITIGAAAEELGTALASSGVPVESVDGLDAAVQLAANRAKPGDTVLFSPACASFDQFRSYEHRGEEFRSFVEALAQGSSVR